MTIASSQARPIFVLGSGRSGTTLVQRILNTAKGVCIWGEHSGFLGPVADAYFQLQGDNDANTFLKRKIGTVEQLADPSHWSAWTNQFNQQSSKLYFTQFVENFFSINESLSTPRWGFKEIRYGAGDCVVEFLSELYPFAHFVFVVRNPIDTVLSQRICGGLLWMGKTTKELAHAWVEQNERYLRLYRASPKMRCLLPYHAIVATPDNVTFRLSERIGLSAIDPNGSVLATRLDSRPTKPSAGEADREEISAITNLLWEELCSENDEF